MKTIFTFCKNYLLLHKWQLFFYVALSIVASLGGLVSPYIVGDFIDQLLNAEDMSFIFRYFVLFAGINLITLCLGYVTGRLYVKLQARLSYALNRDFIKHIQRMPLKFTSKLDTAYLNQRVNNDSNSLIVFCVGIIQNVLVNVVVILMALILIFTFHPILAGILLAVAAVYFTFYTFYKQVLYRVSHANQESQSEFFSKLNEQMFNIRFIKIHSLFEHFVERLNNSFAKVLTTALRYQKAGYIFGGLDQVVMIIAQMVLLTFGGREIIAGRLTIGQFVIISSYFNMMLGAIRYFFSLGQTIQTNMVSYNRLRELANINTEPNGEIVPTRINHIEMKSVSFLYGENGEKSILTDVNLGFTPGQINVILGPNGVGKSTLIDVLMGLQAGNYTGDVLYNGISMNDIDMYKLRNSLIGVTEQEPTLLADTLEYNLSLGQKNNFDTVEIKQITKMLGLEPFMQQFKNIIINENSANISGGEKQKLSLLRALLKNCDILILDEPTSALDTLSKIALRDYLEQVKDSKIVIVITHDSGFIDTKSDRIIQLPL